MLETSPAEKHGGLFGGALTDEAINSSRTVLKNARGNKDLLVGLQQWFTPEPVARFIADVVGPARTVLDPTAGAGSLLAPFDPGSRFGIEIDADHARAAREAVEQRRGSRSAPEEGLGGGLGPEGDRQGYHAIGGDAQSVVPMLRAAGLLFDAVVLNPPFGLSWRDPVHGSGETNSTALAYLWAVDLLGPNGQGAMISGRDRLAKEVLGKPEAKGIYATVEVIGPLFDSAVALPCAISFFHHPENASPYLPDGQGPLRLSARREDLHLLVHEIKRARAARASYLSPRGEAHPWDLLKDWKAVGAEHDRRRRAVGKGRGADKTYDVELARSRVVAHPSPYARLALAKEGRDREVQLLHGQNVAYFGQNGRAWRQLLDLEERELLRLDPALKERAEAVVRDARLRATPLFPVKPHQRLGWLEDLDRILCTKSNPEKGYVAGERYPISTESRVVTTREQRVVENAKTGEPELRHFTLERRLLHLRIGEHSFDEGPESIRLVSEHFELPDPGCVATVSPEKVEKNLSVLGEIEAEIRVHYDRYMRRIGKKDFEPFSFRFFQKDHMSRLLTKGRGLLAHEQGLGKTLMQMVLAEATARIHGARRQFLFCGPQDLCDQWQEAAEMFFGIRFELVRTPAEARRLSQRLRAGEEGWFYTWYGALSLVGRKKELLGVRPTDPLASLDARLRRFKEARRAREYRETLLKDPNAARVPTDLHPLVGAVRGLEKAPARTLTTHACPRCGADTASGWDGEVCRARIREGARYLTGGVAVRQRGCGHVHRKVYRKPAYAHLTTAFKRGVKCVDELSEIRGDDSLRSKAVRAIGRGRHNYGGTGTPLSNYVNDAFWGLFFALGGGTADFPYDYEGGKARFEADFAVLEYAMGREEDGEAHVKKRRKVLPRITNVSQFWRLTAPMVSRCRKEQTGEPLVKRTYHPVRVPLGVRQRKQNEFWLRHFEDYFAWKYPRHRFVEMGLVGRFAAALGQLWRLETAATLPASDAPSLEYPLARKRLDEPSNWTPANLKVLELAYEHAKRGEKVLIGSDLILTGKWVADELNKKGVKSVHITEERGHGEARKVGTKNPKKRAKEVRAFASGDAQVLCAGVQALKLGHNLDVASCVTVSGLPYSFMVLDQFLARVHRLTSRRDVSVYVVIPRRSLAEDKWQLLKDKGGGFGPGVRRGALVAGRGGHRLEQGLEGPRLARSLPGRRRGGRGGGGGRLAGGAGPDRGAAPGGGEAAEQGGGPALPPGPSRPVRVRAGRPLLAGTATEGGGTSWRER
jgi:hypothetical protein